MSEDPINLSELSPIMWDLDQALTVVRMIKSTYQGKCVDFFLMLMEKPKAEEPCLIPPPSFEFEEPPI